MGFGRVVGECRRRGNNRQLDVCSNIANEDERLWLSCQVRFRGKEKDTHTEVGADDGIELGEHDPSRDSFVHRPRWECLGGESRLDLARCHMA